MTAVLALVDVDHTVLQAVIPTVVEIEIKLTSLVKRAFYFMFRDGGGERPFRLVIHNLCYINVKGGCNVVEGFYIHSNLPGFIFAESCAAFMNKVCQLLKRHPLIFSVIADTSANMFTDLAQFDSPCFVRIYTVCVLTVKKSIIYRNASKFYHKETFYVKILL